jgi:hypothetical protein
MEAFFRERTLSLMSASLIHAHKAPSQQWANASSAEQRMMTTALAIVAFVAGFSYFCALTVQHSGSAVLGFLGKATP